MTFYGNWQQQEQLIWGFHCNKEKYLCTGLTLDAASLKDSLCEILEYLTANASDSSVVYWHLFIHIPSARSLLNHHH